MPEKGKKCAGIKHGVTHSGRRTLRVRAGQGCRVEAECEECCLQTRTLQPSNQRQRYHHRFYKIMAQGQSYRMTDICETPSPKPNSQQMPDVVEGVLPRKLCGGNDLFDILRFSECITTQNAKQIMNINNLLKSYVQQSVLPCCTALHVLRLF